METSIREMRVSDIPFVQKLMQQLDDYFQSGHDISIEAIESTFALMEKHKDMYRNYVAAGNDRITGFISIVFYKTFFHTGGTALINELIVDKEHRGKGIGRKLVQKAISIAKVMKMNEIEVGTTPDNSKAIGFYRSVDLTDESILLGKELDK